MKFRAFQGKCPTQGSGRFSDFFVDIDPLISCFEHMRHRKQDLVAFHLLDRQETEFEFDRPIRFQDLEGSGALMTEPAAIQAFLTAVGLPPRAPPISPPRLDRQLEFDDAA